MLGAEGQEKIQKIQRSLREAPPAAFGKYGVEEFIDLQTEGPLVSETDRFAKDILVFHLNGDDSISSIKVTIRPSGTEPKIKVYFELGFQPVDSEDELSRLIKASASVAQEIEKAVLLEMYRAIDVEFPDRGFLLFWQLPLDDKMRYFEVEPQIADLKNIKDAAAKRDKLGELLSFLGANPVQKVDEAFAAEYGMPLLDYLEL